MILYEKDPGEPTKNTTRISEFSKAARYNIDKQISILYPYAIITKMFTV